MRRHDYTLALATAASLAVHAGVITLFARGYLLTPGAVRSDARSAAATRPVPPPDPLPDFVEPLPPEVPPPPPPPEITPEHAFGENAGTGLAINAAEGAEPLAARPAEENQAWLSRDPAGRGARSNQPTPNIAAEGDGGAGGAAAASPTATPPPSALDRSVREHARPDPAFPTKTPPTSPRPTPAIAAALRPLVVDAPPPPASIPPRFGLPDPSDVRLPPPPKFTVPRIGSLPTPEEQREKPTDVSARPPDARARDGPASTRPILAAVPPAMIATADPLPPVDARQPPTDTPREIQQARETYAATAPPATPAAPGRPGGGASADAAPQSESESDAFSTQNALVFRNGRIDARAGRKVRTVNPRFTDAAWADLYALQIRDVKFNLLVDAAGRVRDVRIVSNNGTSGSPTVDQPMKLSLYQWVFEPKKTAGPNRDELVELDYFFR